jgi:hypothetical protein
LADVVVVVVVVVLQLMLSSLVSLCAEYYMSQVK